MIDLGQARELLKRAVETQGRDFVYNVKVGGVTGCFYVPLTEDNIERYELPVRNVSIESVKKTTGCLIGVALDLAGLTFHHGSTAKLYGLTRVDAYLTIEARQYLQVAQDVQDSGGSWGAAYDGAESSLIESSLM